MPQFSAPGGMYRSEWSRTVNLRNIWARLAPNCQRVVDKFEASSNITLRRYAPEDWVTSDVAAEAGKDALKDAGIKAEDLDMVLVGD